MRDHLGRLAALPPNLTKGLHSPVYWAHMWDFFVSYTRADEPWAQWIAWQLEETGYTTFLQAWDFRPGTNFIVRMQEGATQANRTLIVLSTNFLKSKFTRAEWAAALAKDPDGEKGLLIPVRVEEVDPPGLLAAIVYVDLVGLTLNEEAARDTLLHGVRNKRAKPSTPPRFPGVPRDRPVQSLPEYPGYLQEALQIQATSQDLARLYREYSGCARESTAIIGEYLDAYPRTDENWPAISKQFPILQGQLEELSESLDGMADALDAVARFPTSTGIVDWEEFLELEAQTAPAAAKLGLTFTRLWTNRFYKPFIMTFERYPAVKRMEELSDQSGQALGRLNDLAFKGGALSDAIDTRRRRDG
jgi:hypothetical protein